MRIPGLSRKRRPAAACTIIARNFLSHARILAESYLEHEPAAPFYLLVVDRLPEGVDAGPGIHVIDPEELGFPDFDEMCFKYDVTELNTAVKPRLLKVLFDEYGEEFVAYFDPDILCGRPLDELKEAGAASSIVLTPHLLSPIPLDGLKPSEADLLLSGTYNLGFLALTRSDEARALLDWWDERLLEGCRIDIAGGLFVDQKWIDLVPGYFPSTAILRDATYNAAFWNLHERRLERRGDDFLVNGRPLAFYHFSGFDPSKPRILSKHQTRFEVEDGTPLAELLDFYVELHQRHGYEESISWPYGYSAFADTMPVHPFLRRIYLELDDETRSGFGDPFEVGEGSFLAWATTTPADDGALSPFLEYVYSARPDLLGAFPDVHGANRQNFLAWAHQHGPREHDYPPAFARETRPSEPELLTAGADGQAGELAASAADYQQIIRRVREVTRAVLPQGASVLVLSNGDEELLDLEGVRASHFPQTEEGRYLGYHPETSEEAIDHLEVLRKDGAQYLVVPATALWWLDHYWKLNDHLDGYYRVLARREGACVVYELRGYPAARLRSSVAARGPKPVQVEVEVCPSPIFIIGSPRSGTTALGFALGRHSALWTSGELQLVADLLEGQPFRNYRRIGTPQGSWLRDHGIHEAEYSRYLGLGLNALITSRTGSRRWVDHTPTQTLLLHVLGDMFPGAAFIHLLRDGRRVVNSMVNFFQDPSRTGLSAANVQPWALDFREACKTWAKYVEAATAFAEQNPARCLTVRSEKLIADPDGGFHEILEFLGEDFEEDVPTYFQSNRVNSSFGTDRADPEAVWGVSNSDPWSSWTPEQGAIFVEEAGDILVGLGYAGEEELALEEVPG